MPAINYRREFADKVESGSKIHTIRPYRADGRNAKPGQTIYHYTGMRTRSCRKIGENLCTRVRDIQLWIPNFSGLPVIDLDGLRLRATHFAQFAINDGFESIEALCEFFRETYPPDRHFPFSGLLIQWADTEY